MFVVLDVYQTFYNDQGHIFIPCPNRVLTDYDRFKFDAKENGSLNKNIAFQTGVRQDLVNLISLLINRIFNRQQTISRSSLPNPLLPSKLTNPFFS